MEVYEPLKIEDETEDEINEKLRKQQLLESVEKSDLHWVMSDVRGRRFLCRILGGRRILEPSYVPGSFDATAYNEGQRSIAASLFGEMQEISEELYLKMLREDRTFKLKTRRKDKKNGSGDADDK